VAVGGWFNRIVLVVALVVGIFGAWTLQDALSQYVGTARAFADVTIDYQSDSFTWLAPDGSSARFTLVAHNDSTHDAVVESLDVHLYFDSDFAGSNYEGFTQLPLAAGESKTIDVTIDITSHSKADKAGSADLSVLGTADFRFTDITPVRAIDVVASIGVVPLPAASLASGSRP